MGTLIRLEIDLTRLLGKCEAMVKKGLDEEEWRFRKFVEKAEELLYELKASPEKPDAQTVVSYNNRIQFLKGMSEVNAIKSNPIERANVIATVPNMTANDETRDIYHIELQKVNEEIRESLFKKKAELRMRGVKPSSSSLFYTAGTSECSAEPSESAKMDEILTYHHSIQERIADNMISMARNIKEQSLIANTIIKKDMKKVESSTNMADKNIVELKKNADKLQEHTKSNWQCWTWLLLLVVLASFIGMVMVMRVFKKKI